jgi:hypothetical protein
MSTSICVELRTGYGSGYSGFLYNTAELLNWRMFFESCSEYERFYWRLMGLKITSRGILTGVWVN